MTNICSTLVISILRLHLFGVSFEIIFICYNIIIYIVISELGLIFCYGPIDVPNLVWNTFKG